MEKKLNGFFSHIKHKNYKNADVVGVVIMKCNTRMIMTTAIKLIQSYVLRSFQSY